MEKIPAIHSVCQRLITPSHTHHTRPSADWLNPRGKPLEITLAHPPCPDTSACFPLLLPSGRQESCRPVKLCSNLFDHKCFVVASLLLWVAKLQYSVIPSDFTVHKLYLPTYLSIFLYFNSKHINRAKKNVRKLVNTMWKNKKMAVWCIEP